MDTIGTHQLEQFRQQVYRNFNNRADTLMELVDALSSNTDAKSTMALSLNPLFRRHYTVLYTAVAEMGPGEKTLAQLVGPHLPQPASFPFWLLSVDVASQPRPFSPTLQDRSIVYQPNPVRGNKPVTVGHRFSTVALLVEKEATTVPWVVPLATVRVEANADKEMRGAEQVDAMLSDPYLPVNGALCVEVGDTSYSKPAYLHANRHHRNVVTIARACSNRTFYRTPSEEPSRLGHPRWYGKPFSLKEPDTWHQPDETITTIHVSRRGCQYQVCIDAWHDMLMRGKRKPQRLPMHRYPFTLMRVYWFDDNGQPVYKRPLWFIIVGQRRHEVDLLSAYQAYIHRSHLEHFFLFANQKLLPTRLCSQCQKSKIKQVGELTHRQVLTT